MGSTKINIVFDSPNTSYYAGSLLTGKAIFTVNKPKKVRAITLYVVGKGKVWWSDIDKVASAAATVAASSNEPDKKIKPKPVEIAQSAEEEYLNVKYNLAGSSAEIEIPTGEHVYPFSVTLPNNLPSTFHGDHGDIEYSVKVVVDRPWKFDFEQECSFIVVNHVNLNLAPSYVTEPVNLEGVKYFWCWCCASKPLIYTITLPHSGYVPGEPILIKIIIKNGSEIDVNEVSCVVNRTLTWISNRPKPSKKFTKLELCSGNDADGVKGESERTIKCQLQMPTCPVLNFTGSSIISVEYKLDIVFKVSGCHMNVNESIPLYVGDMPIL